MRRQIQTAAFDVPEYEPRRVGDYRPRINPRHLRRLWLEKQRIKKPITKLIDKALVQYFESRQAR